MERKPVPPTAGVGPQWRGLDEDAGLREGAVAGEPAAPQRRDFLRLAGASLALAGLAGCGRPPDEPIVPYVEAPENLVAGQPTFYATALPLDGYGLGVLVETAMGRPTKVEGNPAHPASRGATDVYAQAAIHDLWDPDRSRTVLKDGRPASRSALQDALAGQRDALAERDGQGLAILTGTVTSPTLAAQLTDLLERYPRARWFHPPPAGEEAALAAAAAAFGERLVPRPRLDRARVVLALDADPAGPGPGQVAHARDLAAARDPDGDHFLRLWAAEPTPSLTGALADHRLPLRFDAVAGLARQVAARLGLDVPAPPVDGIPQGWLDALVTDLSAAGPHALVIAGPRQPLAVHLLAAAINRRLGAPGTTLDHAPSAAATATPHAGGLPELAAALRDDDVDLLLVLETNPVYQAPADLDMAAALGHAGAVVHLGLYADETAAASRWHVPAAHPLEAWGDLRSSDGSAAIVQPAIAPLHGGMTPGELLSLLADGTPRNAHELVQAHWRGELGADGFDNAWHGLLRTGVVADTALATRSVSLREDWREALPPPPSPAAGLEVVFTTAARARDGTFANNAWLQELPDPLTSLTWGNAALMAPATAERLGLEDGDVVRIEAGGRSLEAPLWRQPGQAEDTLTLPLGYGRRRAGRVGDGVGFDANALRTALRPWHQPGVTVTATGRRVALAATQHHHALAMDGHQPPPVRSATVAAYRHRGGPLVDEPTLPSLYPSRRRGRHAWGMSIDLGACIGCGACTIACQAENNIPVVGAAEVRRGREMHWIRVDRYFAGPPQAPDLLFQPVPCMHCEDAPCEVVCPVAATVHDAEGLNLQVYNRCVGTRFCSNNCPYKVRRFNFLQYTADEPSAAARHNPDVTVRRRGVMEKCTYCLQRINAARGAARDEGREMADGDVVTACQGACPTRAIVFGDLELAGSRVARAAASDRSYSLLRELNTRPRTTYRVRLTHPHPDLAGEPS